MTGSMTTSSKVVAGAMHVAGLKARLAPCLRCGSSCEISHVASRIEARQIPDAEGIKTVPFDEVESGADGVASTEEKRGIAILFEEDDILDHRSMDCESLLVREATHLAGKASLEDHFSRDSKP